jgi:nitrate reductase gamma subunit
MSPDAGHRAAAVALAVARGLAAIIGLTLLFWAYVILDNIWTYNDSGTLTYVVIALVVGVPGLVLLAFALRGIRR